MYNVHMNVSFTWDDSKGKENIKKHGVSFEEAVTIFRNFPLEVYYDPDHSFLEDRYIAIGFSNKGRALLVVHCENKKGTIVRLISARKATQKEKWTVFGGKHEKRI